MVYLEMLNEQVLPELLNVFDTLSTHAFGIKSLCTTSLHKVFSNLNNKEKYCKILADEMHIKPAIRYQGNHVVGYATD